METVQRVLMCDQSAKFFYKIIIVLAASVYIGTLFYYQVDFTDTLKYFSFQLLYIFLPGYTLRYLLKISGENTLIFWSYGLGVALMVVEYIFFSFLGWLPGIHFLSLSMDCFSFLILYRATYRNELVTAFKSIPIQIWFIYSFLLLAATMGFSLKNPSPIFHDEVSYYQDILWNIGNAAALNNSFPPYDSRISNVLFRYHYFSPAFAAAMESITKIDLFTIVFRFIHPGSLFLAVGSIYSMGVIVLQEKQKAVFFTWIYFLTSCASLFFAFREGQSVFLNISLFHLTTVPTCGFDLALPMFVYAVATCFMQLKAKDINYHCLLATMLFVFVCTGSKGPSGFLIFGGLLVVALTLLLLKRNNKKVWILLFTAIVATMFAYWFFIKDTDNYQGRNGLYINPGYTVERTAVGKYFPGWLGEGAALRIIESILIPVHFFFFLPFASILFFFWFKDLTNSFRSANITDLMISALALSGTGLAYFFAQNGQSQIYFIMFSVPLIELAAVLWFFKNFSLLSIQIKRIILVFFVMGSISSFSYLAYHVKEGVKMVFNPVVVLHKFTERNFIGNGISRYESEAMQWLKENTSSKAVIASERYYINPKENDSRYFYYSAFSERQIFLEGWLYQNDNVRNNIVPQKLAVMKKLYDDKYQEKTLLMRENNIDYVVVLKKLHPQTADFDDHLILVYENPGVKIYLRKDT